MVCRRVNFASRCIRDYAVWGCVLICVSISIRVIPIIGVRINGWIARPSRIHEARAITSVFYRDLIF